MHNNKSLNLLARVKSFGYALNGFKEIWKEPNFKIHALAVILVIIFGIYKHITILNWLVLFLAIGLVLVTEAFNTCVEKICDFCSENQIHPKIKIIKDIAAAAVLLAAITSLCIGIGVFWN